MILLAVTAVAGGACAGDQTEAAPEARTTPSTQAAPAAPAATATKDGAAVTIDTFRFDPDPLTVERGQAVTWSNNDAIAHTVTHNGGAFDMELADKGTTASHTFAEAGTFEYTCTRHPGMAGSVIVR